MRHPTRLCAALAVAFGGLAAGQVQAQDQGNQQLERVVVTGSSIKRLESETALPVTVITRAQIEKTGATNVEDLLRRVSAATAAVSDTTQGAGYATSNANLRGLGPNSTLVLLNGRRLANHPFGNIGGAVAVDLNSIPFAAIERVEVLRDGASAVYGTDAVGGVINFITRKDYGGGNISLRAGNTEDDIGGKETGASLALGFGDIGSDGFNLLVTANVQKNTRLKAIEQKFYNRGVQEIPGSAPPTSGGAFPGRLVDFRVAPGAYPSTNPNFEACDPNFTTRALQRNSDGTPALSPNGTERFICRFIYAATLDNLPDQDKADVFSRATWNLSKDAQMFAELSFARNASIGRIAPTPIFWGATSLDPVKGDYAHPLMPVSSPFFPRDLLKSLGWTDAQLAGDANGMTEIAMRAIPAGNRINDNTNTQARFVLGSTGVLAGWDYDTAFNYAKAKGDLEYRGYIHEGRFLAELAAGNINPFGPSGANGDAAWARAALTGPMRKSDSTTMEVDFKLSRELGAMAGGNMAVAMGVDFRREKAEDRPVNADYSAGKHIGGEGTVPLTIASRNISAVFGELSMPFAKGVEAGLSARYDRYSDFGGTFNPRATIRWNPSKEFLLRGAFGTGFRAPTLWDVNAPTSSTNTANNLQDPDCPAGFDGDPRCDIQFNVRNFSSPDLKPEKSRQASLGFVFEPNRHFSAAVDLWTITKRDLIGQIGGDALMSNPTLYQRFKSRVKRNAQGFILYIETPVENLGELKTSGVDIDLRGSIPLGDMGTLRPGFNATHISKWKRQSEKGGAFTSFEGTAGDGAGVQPVPEWQHSASLDWAFGSFNFTVENTFVKGWTESAGLVEANVFVAAEHKVKDTNRINLAAGYTGIKGLNLRLGVKNVTDKEPPFTAVSSNGSHAAGYAASFADPRGRYWYGSVSYEFK